MDLKRKGQTMNSTVTMPTWQNPHTPSAEVLDKSPVLVSGWLPTRGVHTWVQISRSLVVSTCRYEIRARIGHQHFSTCTCTAEAALEALGKMLEHKPDVWRC